MPNILKKLNSFTAMRVKYGSFAVIASAGITVEYLVLAGGGGGGAVRRLQHNRSGMRLEGGDEAAV